MCMVNKAAHAFDGAKLAINIQKTLKNSDF